MSTFLRHTKTPITAADGQRFWWVPGGANGDVIGVKVRDTDSHCVEVHVLDGSENYQRFSLQMPTPISEADANNFFFTGGDGDVIGVKTDNTDSGKVEVHFLDGSKKYQRFSRQKTTAIDVKESHKFHWVKGAGNGDVIGIKLFDTDSKNVEVHVLDGDEDYQSFSLQTATSMYEGTGQYAYKWCGHGGHIAAVKWVNTDSKKAEVYMFEPETDYYSWVGGLDHLTPFDAPDDAKNFHWLLVDVNDDGYDEVVGVKYDKTASKMIEIFALDGVGVTRKPPPPEKYEPPPPPDDERIYAGRASSAEGDWGEDDIPDDFQTDDSGSSDSDG